MMKYKIFIITIPLIGHMTPLVASLKELTSANVQVIVYSTKKFQIPIEQCDAEFRELKNVDREPIKINDPCKDKVHLKLLVAFMLEKQMQIFDKTVVQVVRDILTDCPDLILYDDFAFYAKLTLRFLRENRSNLMFLSKLVGLNFTEVIEMPKFAAYTTTIPVTLPTFFSMPNHGIPAMAYHYNCYIYKGLPGVYPDEEDLKLSIQSTNLKIKIKTLKKFLRIILKMYKISSKYNVKFMLPFKELYRTGDNTLLLIFSIPKLQPRYEFYDKKIRKFVGACIAMETRLSKADDDQYIDKCILENKRLVYASLGSLFNAKTDVYKTIINAFKSKEIQAENLYAIIATGEKAFDELETIMERKLLTLPNNVKLVRVAPQLTILQHAKLFITHSGFNSVKEALYYGVPMICVPIAADQPLVAHHITANLELGIKLDVNSLNEILIINSIKQILNDNRYYERCAKCSDILKETDGAKNFSNEILSYLNDKKKH